MYTWVEIYFCWKSFPKQPHDSSKSSSWWINYFLFLSLTTRQEEGSIHLYFESKKLNKCKISSKMKFVFFFFLLLSKGLQLFINQYLFLQWKGSFSYCCFPPGFSHSEGKQQQTERFQHIFLRFSFPPFYNSYTKYCCKLYPGGCYRLLDSAGYTCDSLRGRVGQTEMNALVEFEISDVQLGDAGFYRCRVQGTPVYSDYYVEVFGKTFF